MPTLEVGGLSPEMPQHKLKPLLKHSVMSPKSSLLKAKIRSDFRGAALGEPSDQGGADFMMVN